MDSSPQRVLLVDDQPLIQQVVEQMLRPRYTVTCANDVAGALEELTLFEFDVIIADLELGDPRRNGRWLLERAAEHLPAARLVLMSGHHLDREEPGNARYLLLPKPFTREVLEAALSPEG